MVFTSVLIRQYESFFPEVDFSFVLGTDNVREIKSWEGYEEVLKGQKFVVFNRGVSDEREIKEILPNSQLIYGDTGVIASTQI